MTSVGCITGSGGSIWVDSRVIEGWGAMTANGANGGGRHCWSSYCSAYCVPGMYIFTFYVNTFFKNYIMSGGSVISE